MRKTVDPFPCYLHPPALHTPIVSAGRAIFGVGSGLGVALLGVGYIVGFNIAVLVFIGGAVAWLLGIPLYTALADPAVVSEITGGAGGHAAAEAIWSERIRYLGVGAMAVGGVWALVSVFRLVLDGVRFSLEVVPTKLLIDGWYIERCLPTNNSENEQIENRRAKQSP